MATAAVAAAVAAAAAMAATAVAAAPAVAAALVAAAAAVATAVAAAAAGSAAAPVVASTAGPGASEVLSVGAAATTSLVPAFVADSGATSPIAQLSFTLDSGASSCFFRDCTDLTPLYTPVTVALAYPSVGSVVAHSTTILPSPVAPSGFLTCYYTPSFSRNLVGVSHLHDLGVITNSPLDEPVASCTVGATGVPLASFHRSPRVAYPASSLACAAVHSLRRGSATLHLDIWGPSPVRGPRQECYFMIVVDDYSRYTTVLPLRWKADVPTVLEPWLLVRGDAQAICGLRLHVDRGAADYHVWGSLAHVRAPGTNTSSPHTRACVFLGFPLYTSGWQLYDPVTCQFFSSQDVTFDDSPPPSCPAPSGVSHVTLRSSPLQRPVPIMSGGAGGAAAEGVCIGATGACGAGSGGAGGVRVETTSEEDTAVLTQRPRPASPPGFLSVPQFPPRSPLRPVAAEPGGVPVEGTGVPGGVVGGGSGFGGPEARDTGITTPTPCTQERVEELRPQQQVQLQPYQERVEELRPQQQVQMQPQQERVEEESRLQQQVQLQPPRERVEEEPHLEQEEQQQGQAPPQQTSEEAEQQRLRDLPDPTPARL
ncbi:unnamed protein product, partial [Closterium sp. NIES-54]